MDRIIVPVMRVHGVNDASLRVISSKKDIHNTQIPSETCSKLWSMEAVVSRYGSGRLPIAYIVFVRHQIQFPNDDEKRQILQLIDSDGSSMINKNTYRIRVDALIENARHTNAQPKNTE